MKRILYIHHAGGIGGAPLSLLYLIQHLDRSRYEPVVAVLRPGGRDLWRLPGKLARVPGSIARTRALVERLHPDLVHLNSSTLAPSAIGAARAGVPVVWHIREPLAHGYVGLRRAWIRRVIDRCADRVVALSGHDADQLIASPRIRVIHNFVHFDRFDRSLTGEAIRREFDIQVDAPVVAMLGGISEPKGTLTLIRAIPALIEAVPGVRVVIAGLPPHPLDEPGLKGLVKRVLAVDAYPRAVIQAIAGLGPAARAALIFTGIRRDMPEILAASACLVFPSTVPHFARPVIEAAAMGVPSVASDLGGPRELIADGETGLLIPPRNPAALAAGISALLSDPARARSFGEAAYRRAREMFDAGTNAAATVALYGEILDDRG
jgi:glycosyltransferase involved in cell wall biosynthesis